MAGHTPILASLTSWRSITELLPMRIRGTAAFCWPCPRRRRPSPRVRLPLGRWRPLPDRVRRDTERQFIAGLFGAHTAGTSAEHDADGSTVMPGARNRSLDHA